MKGYEIRKDPKTGEIRVEVEGFGKLFETRDAKTVVRMCPECGTFFTAEDLDTLADMTGGDSSRCDECNTELVEPDCEECLAKAVPHFTDGEPPTDDDEEDDRDIS